MNILEIYEQYKIMPQLQEHQLRVAGVAFLICKAMGESVDGENVVTACLLHDMGNILKFNLETELIPGQFEPHGQQYWQDVKEEFKKKYGPNEHRAALEIAKEIGVSSRIVELIDSIGFLQSIENVSSEDFGKKVCAYSDMRVDPAGVVSLQQRFDDLCKRYNGERALTPPSQVLEFENAIRKIEEQIFEQIQIKPEEVTNERVKGVEGELMGLEF